jgi:3-oxoacyl-[acyl-carrier protein] reductase
MRGVVRLGIAKQLAIAGHQVIAVARKESDQLVSAMYKVHEQGAGSHHFRPFDLNEIAAPLGLVKELQGKFGSLRALVNNASLGTSGILAITPDPLIERLLRLNVLFPITLTKYSVRSMMTDGNGHRIVNIASIIATTGFSGLSVYSATKAAFVGFTHSLARELGPFGITANAVAPGFVDTDMTQNIWDIECDQIIKRGSLRRQPEIGDIANAAEFLLIDKTANITGTVLTVDGGNTV